MYENKDIYIYINVDLKPHTLVQTLSCHHIVGLDITLGLLVDVAF